MEAGFTSASLKTMERTSYTEAPVLQKTICGGIYARVYCIFTVQCRCKESSRSLSHLMMSFLFVWL